MSNFKDTNQNTKSKLTYYFEPKINLMFEPYNFWQMK